MRSITPPFLVAPPAGARIRTRLRVGAGDERVLRAVGEYLGRWPGPILPHDAAWAPATTSALSASGP